MLIEKGGKMLGKLKDEGSARFVGCLTEEINAARDDRKRIAFYKSLKEDIEEKRRSLNSPYLDSQEFENFRSDCKPFDRLMKHIDTPQCSDDEKITEIVSEAKARSSKLTVDDHSHLETLCNFVITKYEEFLKETDPESYNRSMKAKKAIEQENKRNSSRRETEKNICGKIDEIRNTYAPQDPIRPWIPTTVDGLELTYRYKTDKLPLIGRDDEMETLRDFCNASTPFLWYAICGPGGMGKSRLAYELAIEMRHERWTVYWLKSTDYKYLNDMSFEGKNNVLIVADYVLMHTKEISECIQRLESIETKIRLLLLERANKNLGQPSEDDSLHSFSDSGQNYPLWISFQSISSDSSRLKYSLFKNDPREFLFLDALLDEKIEEVIKTYAKVIVPSKQLSGNECKRILERLKVIDEEFRRPLYARVIIFLWARDADWQAYSTAKLMEEIFDHEMDRWKAYLEDMSNISFQNELLEMLAIVTIHGGMTENEMKSVYQTLYKEMNRCLRENVISFFAKNEMLDISSNGEDILCAVEPDLFGEYLVLTWLNRQSKQNDRLNIIFNNKWPENINKYIFINQFCRDYARLLTVEFWNRFLNLRTDSLDYYYILIQIVDCRIKILKNIDSQTIEKAIGILLKMNCKTDESHAFFYLCNGGLDAIYEWEQHLNYPPTQIIKDLGILFKKFAWRECANSAVGFLCGYIFTIYCSKEYDKSDISVKANCYKEAKKICEENKDSISFPDENSFSFTEHMHTVLNSLLNSVIDYYEELGCRMKKEELIASREYVAEMKYVIELEPSGYSNEYARVLSVFSQWEDLITTKKYNEELKKLYKRKFPRYELLDLNAIKLEYQQN